MLFVALQSSAKKETESTYTSDSGRRITNVSKKTLYPADMFFFLILSILNNQRVKKRYFGIFVWPIGIF